MRIHEWVQGRGGWLVAGLGAAVLVAGCGGSSTSPSNATLTPNAATVQAALNTYTTGAVSIPPYCGTTGVNCPGGVAGSATKVDFTRSGLTITQAAPDSFAYAMDLAIATESPFTVSANGIDCGVAVNTAAGSSPTVHVAGTAIFTSQTMSGPINEVDLSTTLTGAESADLTMSGGSTCTALGTVSQYVAGAMLLALTNGTTRLCAGSGGHVTTCS